MVPSERTDSAEWVSLPTLIDSIGNRVVMLDDESGTPRRRLVAEIVLVTFIGPRPPGHHVHFKDGDQLNCHLSNLEWAPADSADSSTKGREVRVRHARARADAIRASLLGRHHSDSGELQAEDRLR